MMPDILPEMSDGFYDSPTKKDTKSPYQKLMDIVVQHPDDHDFSKLYEYNKDHLEPALSQVDAEELTQNDGEILLHAIKHNAPRCVSAFINKTTSWPEKVVCEALRGAAKNNNSSSVSSLFGLDFPMKRDMITQLNNQRSEYNHDMRNAIDTAKANFIGTQWKKISQHEIAHTIESNLATIEHIFNFNAMSIVTIAKKENNITMAERNFRDVQDDADIVRAHETLSIFEQPPAYRGKNHTPRRSVNKRTPVNG